MECLFPLSYFETELPIKRSDRGSLMPFDSMLVTSRTVLHETRQHVPAMTIYKPKEKFDINNTFKLLVKSYKKRY